MKNETRIELIQEMQRRHLYLPQVAVCPTFSSSGTVTPAPPPVTGVRDRFVVQQQQLGLAGFQRQRPFSLGIKPTALTFPSTTFPANLHWNFNLGLNLTGIGVAPTPTVTQTTVVNLEDARLHQGIIEFQPEKRCTSL